MPQTLLTLDEVAKMLRVSYPRTAELARSGLLPVVRIGRQIRVSEDALDAFIVGGGKALPGGWRKAAKDPQGKNREETKE